MKQESEEKKPVKTGSFTSFPVSVFSCKVRKAHREKCSAGIYYL